MKKCTYIVVFCFAVILFSFAYSHTSFAKKRCKPFLEKLHNIQTTQRTGYSLKRGENLRGKEDKARDKWWQCENSSQAKFKAQYGGKKKKAKKRTKHKKDKAVKKNTYYTKLNKISSYSQHQETRFNQHSAIVIKSKYQGDKKMSWLDFYHQPIKCQYPKTMSIFAYCSENKLQQQSAFEQSYRD
ncbi:hypothetical protein [Colwellia sp. 12G3]|uniref:hypothetical protein n=1 Tax=Colwellia sp. 12G3 TaxID=2058299 RepID=UPI000C34B109|nr:hypothetical protein [Colwellia sp. 12G3]PKI13025.1 hypothetical protein CXF71_20180 [Colwellia sp. 12G3]